MVENMIVPIKECWVLGYKFPKIKEYLSERGYSGITEKDVSNCMHLIMEQKHVCN